MMIIFMQSVCSAGRTEDPGVIASLFQHMSMCDVLLGGQQLEMREKILQKCNFYQKTGKSDHVGFSTLAARVLMFTNGS